MRPKTKVLFAVAGVFYIWYAAAGILLNCTTLDLPKHRKFGSDCCPLPRF